MKYLAIDWGEKRWGIGYGDELGVATPLDAIVDAEISARWIHLEKVVRERRIDTLVVGYPLNMDGSVGFKAREVDHFIDEVNQRLPHLPVVRTDERLTSHAAGKHWSGKKKREQRKSGKLDSAAAAVFLQDYLDHTNMNLPPEILLNNEDDPS